MPTAVKDSAVREALIKKKKCPNSGLVSEKKYIVLFVTIGGGGGGGGARPVGPGKEGAAAAGACAAWGALRLWRA